MLTYYRDLVWSIVPTWFKRGAAARLLYVISLHFDALERRIGDAVKLGFAGYGGFENLPYLSREHRIRQGIGETDLHFAGRLAHYLEAHKDRGGPYPLLEQLFEHYRFSANDAGAPGSPGAAFPIHLVYTSGARFDMSTAGVVTRDEASFTTGLAPDEWAHWWLVYEWPSTIAVDGLWDDAGVYDDGGVWDSELAVADVKDLRLIPAEWNDAYCYGTIVVLSPGQALWDFPEELWSDSGTWDADGAALVQVEIE